MEYFQRHVYLASRLSASQHVPTLRAYRLDTDDTNRTSLQVTCFDAASSRLTSEATSSDALYSDLKHPCLISRFEPTQSLSDWLSHQTMLPRRSDVALFITRFLKSLSALHRLGYVHGRLHPEHLRVTADGKPMLFGLGRCQPIDAPHFVAGASPLCIRMDRWARYTAPELAREHELCGSADIYSAGMLLADILGAPFLQSNLGRCMTSGNPSVRPMASELVALFSELHRSLPAAA